MHRGRRYKIESMTSPPPFLNSSDSFGYYCKDLGAFARPTTVRYSTRALSINTITIVKQLYRAEIMKKPKTHATEEAKRNNDITNSGLREEFDFRPGLRFGSIAGNGVVTVKKTVHGYKKLSLVNRAELSRSEITLPPMEFDTNALWIDTEASVLSEVMPNYDKGVHALSHAIVAVAPLFVPCTSSDIDCDHSHHGCTRVLLFDTRAGGAGTCAQLWDHFFSSNGVLDAVIDLLSECPSDCDSGTYQGGCPGCIQAVPCINFHEDLSRSAGLYIARRMLARLQQSPMYAQDTRSSVEGKCTVICETETRKKALRNASNLQSAREKGVVVGRPSWPTDDKVI